MFLVNKITGASAASVARVSFLSNFTCIMRESMFVCVCACEGKRKREREGGGEQISETHIRKVRHVSTGTKFL